MQLYDNDVADDIEKLVDTYAASQKLDVRRVYLTGLSQGSIGTWNLAAARPGWAAIALVSGGLRPPHGGGALKDTPIWAFHAPNDVICRWPSDKSVDACEGSDADRGNKVHARRGGRVLPVLGRGRHTRHAVAWRNEPVVYPCGVLRRSSSSNLKTPVLGPTIPRF